MLPALTARRTISFLRPHLVRQTPSHLAKRSYHVENRVGNNFPFDYDGASKTKFTVAYWGLLLGVGFCGIPGLAWWLQMEKFNGNL